MKELHLFYAPELPHTLSLPQEEAQHALRVLRMKEGDELIATDGRGRYYNCTIALAASKRCVLNVQQETMAAPYWRGNIHLAVAPTKSMERTEWLAEKATEIGFDKLSLIDCKNSERHVVKTERLERIVIAATKQSHKAWKPMIEEMTPFSRFISCPHEGQKFIAHCYDMNLSGNGTGESICQPTPFLGDIVNQEGDALILIGPEGDFTEDEVRAALAAGFQPVSLGKSRLRTETAALFAVQMLQMTKRIH